MLQLSVGPVFFAVLHKSINEGFSEALKMTFAVALVDAFYICISFTAISTLFKVQYLHKIISILGMIVLIYFGLTYIRNANKKSDAFENKNKSNSFINGLKLTLINPLTIVFWSGTFASLIAANKLIGIFNIVIYSIGCVSATIIFLAITSLSGKYIKKFINIKVLKLIDYTIGIILIYFAIKIALR
nr:LysE family transporter [Clostridium mobile]